MSKPESIVEGIKQYFDECPLIKKMGAKTKVEFLKDDTRSFSIETVPGPSVIENYLDGVSERQYRFNLVARFSYSEEARMNIENSQFFEELAAWIEEQSDEENLPELPKGDEAEELNVTTTGYLFAVSADWRIARYQLQLQLVYMHDSRTAKSKG